MRAARVVNLFAAQTFYDRCRASNLRCPPALYDQQETATIVLDTGHRLDEKAGSSQSRSEIETFRCQALAQRFPTATKGWILEVRSQLFACRCSPATEPVN